MFDDIAENYEANFSHDPSLLRAIDQALELINPNSCILDVGCGTGKPVSYKMAEAGHSVTGIDISQKMIDKASGQVKGEFYKTDMAKYCPTKQFDAVFAVFSLFNMSRHQTNDMLFKFHTWLNPGGRLVLATIPSVSLFQDQSLYDESGEWVDGKPMYFMGHEFHGSAATRRGWQELVCKAGFEIEVEFSHLFSPTSSGVHKKNPDHHYFIARRVVVE